MGLSDIAPAPLPTTCLKRCRSEETLSSVSAQLCPPPSKQPFIPSAHHRSILQDLENSLDFPPNTEAAAAPEAFVTEMMQSLEKVMGDIAELMATSSGSHAPSSVPPNSAPFAFSSLENSLQTHEGHAYASIPCNGSSLPPMSGNSFQQAGTAQTDSLRVWTLRSSDSAEPGASSMAANGPANLCTDAGIADGHLPELISTTFDEYGVELANYEVEIESREPRSRLDVGFLHVQVTNEDSSELACSVADDCHSQGSVSSLNNSEQKAPSERIDGGWGLLDEFAEDLSSAALQLNCIVWPEDVSDIPAFTFLPQAEEETWLLNARDNSEMLGFDCSL